MTYTQLTPSEVFAFGFDAPELVENSWLIRWDRLCQDPVAVCHQGLPPTVDFYTSGTTQPRRCWRRSRETLVLEASILAQLVAPEQPDSVVSCAPTGHLFGALASVLLPAHLGLPVWHRASMLGALPAVAGRVLLVATPWVFQILLRNKEWLHHVEHLTVLYGGARLPGKAEELLELLGPRRGRIIEVLGSTEAGGMAVRQWCEGDPPPWTLFSDVSFAGPIKAGVEVPLAVRSARLAFRPGEGCPESWKSDDWVLPLADGRFRLLGRDARLVKVNGRRIDLEGAEQALRGVLECADLCLMPVMDELVGEHVELLVVPAGDGGLDKRELATAFTVLGVRPKRVHMVTRIERSALGKPRYLQPKNQ